MPSRSPSIQLPRSVSSAIPRTFSRTSGATAVSVNRHPPHAAEREEAKDRRQPEEREESRPGVRPGHRAHEPLASGFDHLADRVVLGDRLEPARQEVLGRVGGGGEDRQEHPDLHQGRRRLRPEPEGERRAPGGRHDGHPHHQEESDQQPEQPRPVDPDREADGKQEGGRQERAQARREDQAGEQDGARRGSGDQPVEPALLEVAGEVHAGCGAGEAGPLEHADRDQEALVARGGESRQQGEAAEHAGQAEEEDGGGEDAGDRGPWDPEDLVERPPDERPDRRDVGSPAHTPLLTRPRRAPSQSSSPKAPIPITDATALSCVVRCQPSITGSRIPLTMKLSGLYCAIQAAGSSIRFAGKNASERNRITKTSGKIPWTTLALLVRSAIAAPIDPKASADVEVRTTIQIAAGIPSLISAPKISPSTMK